MICFGIGILLAIGGIYAFIASFKDAMSYDSPMAGLGVIFGFAYWLVLTLLGIISVLIGLLLRK